MTQKIRHNSYRKCQDCEQWFAKIKKFTVTGRAGVKIANKQMCEECFDKSIYATQRIYNGT